jgi:hypothetical protein
LSFLLKSSCNSRFTPARIYYLTVWVGERCVIRIKKLFFRPSMFIPHTLRSATSLVLNTLVVIYRA